MSGCPSKNGFNCQQDPFVFANKPDDLVLHLETPDGVYGRVLASLEDSDERLLEIVQMQLDVIRQTKERRARLGS